MLRLCALVFFLFFKQKTAYEMRISDWSSDVCSSDLNSSSIGRLVTPATTRPLRASATLTPHSGLPNRKLVVPSSGSTIQVWPPSLPSNVPLSSPRKPYSGRAADNIRRMLRSASSSAIDTRSAGPLLLRTAISDRRAKCAFSPSPAARAASIIAIRSGEAFSTCGSFASNLIAQARAPQAGGQQQRQHRRADPEPDRRTEVVHAHAVDHAHAGLDQRAGHLFLDPRADVAEDPDHAHRRTGHALGRDVDREQPAQRGHQASQAHAEQHHGQQQHRHRLRATKKQPQAGQFHRADTEVERRAAAVGGYEGQEPESDATADTKNKQK